MGCIEVKKHIASLRNLYRVSQRTRKIGEELHHLISRAEILLGGKQPRSTRIVKNTTLMDAGPYLVCFKVIRRYKPHRIGRDHRGVNLRGDVKRAAFEGVLAGSTGS